MEIFVRRSSLYYPKGITPKIVDNIIFFTIDKPQNLSIIKLNGDRLTILHLVAGEIIENTPEKGTPSVIHFEVGFHKPDSINLRLVITKEQIFHNLYYYK